MAKLILRNKEFEVHAGMTLLSALKKINIVPESVIATKNGENQLYVMGDNRPNSSDSRVFGPISQDLAVGKAWLRIWPFNKFGIVEHEDLVLPTPVTAPTTQ